MEKSLLLLLAGYTLGTHVMLAIIYFSWNSWIKISQNQSPTTLVEYKVPIFDKIFLERLCSFLLSVIFYQAISDKRKKLPEGEKETVIYLPEKIDDDYES